jgi:cardiolipin synthase
LKWILWLYLLNTIFMLIIAIREVRRPAKAMNWLVIGLILPVIGFGFYLIISNPEQIRRKRLTSPHNDSETLPDLFSHSTSVIAHALQHFAVNGLRTGQVQVLTNGIETYGKIIESLNIAQRTIDLEYYTYRDDHIGRRITDLLIERSKSGVNVRFVRDGWGSKQFPQHQILRMMDAGIECRTIFPLRFPRFMSTLIYRDHCKIVVIDGKEAFTGGINVGDEYTGLKPNVGFWRDTHLRIAGDAAADLQTIFHSHWNMASPELTKIRTRGNKKTRNPHNPTPVSRHKSNIKVPSGKSAFSGWSAEWSSEPGTLEVNGDDNVLSKKVLKEAFVQTLEGNPGIPTQVIREAYFICLTQAAQTVDITTPYFVPEADIIIALKTAVARGVRVRLLVPRHVIPRIVGPASRTYYGELLEAGVQIYMYEKGMLHAKLMVIDSEIAEVGSANYDLRSYRLNYEVCEFIYSAEVALELTEQFERDLTNSTPLRMEELLQRSVSQRIIDQAARLLSPLL